MRYMKFKTKTPISRFIIAFPLFLNHMQEKNTLSKSSETHLYLRSKYDELKVAP
jgi:hypothetical protein